MLPLRWYAISTCLALVMMSAPALLSPTVSLRLVEAPLAFLVVGGVAGAAEEPAWRGYRLAALQQRMPVLVAALVVGVFWTLWHLPLFLLEGTYQAGLGVGTRGFWGFQVALLVGSPLYAWLYNVRRRIVFSVVWFHAVSNIIAEALVDGSDAALCRRRCRGLAGADRDRLAVDDPTWSRPARSRHPGGPERADVVQP